MGGGSAETGRLLVWAFVLLIAQGLFPILKFGFKDGPKLAKAYVRTHAKEAGVFVVLLIAAAILFL